MLAYVGSRTTRERNARGEGISVYRCHADGNLSLLQVYGGLINPSFLVLNRAGNRLYAVHGDCSTVSAFAANPRTGQLDLLNCQSTEGKNPVYLALDPSERFLVVSNHLSSSLAVVALARDGRLEPQVRLLTLEGTLSPHRTEQPFAKPHCNLFDPSGQYVLVPDKGLDAVFCFRFQAGRLIPTTQPKMTAREGSGPRHLAFHPKKPWVYVINELDSTVTACSFDAQSGGVHPFRILSTLSDRYTGNSRASEIALHPLGHTLYAANRGEDTVAAFSIAPDTGRMSLLQSISSGGNTPRFFALTPEGSFMHVLNETTDSIVTFAVNAHVGTLTATDLKYACGSPVCMTFGAYANGQ